RFYLDAGRLPLPRRADLALLLAVAAHVGVVDGQHALALAVGPVPRGAPPLRRRQRDRRLREGGVDRPLPLLGVLVEVHAGARGVDDEHALLAQNLRDLVHRRRQFSDPLRRRLAPVVVPHVADDQGGVRPLPRDGLLDGGVFLLLRPRAQR